MSREDEIFKRLAEIKARKESIGRPTRDNFDSMAEYSKLEDERSKLLSELQTIQKK